jgi:predicted MFS family arabinose efflux permease
MSSLMIFMINVKNFGLRYYSDQAITQTSFVALIASFAMRPCIGVLIDKLGVRIAYRIIAGVTIVTVLVFYLFMDNIWVFYLCVMLFYGSYSCMAILIIISTSFVYDHDVGKRLQKVMYCAFSAAGCTTVLIHDNFMLQIFG